MSVAAFPNPRSSKQRIRSSWPITFRPPTLRPRGSAGNRGLVLGIRTAVCYCLPHLHRRATVSSPPRRRDRQSHQRSRCPTNRELRHVTAGRFTAGLAEMRAKIADFRTEIANLETNLIRRMARTVIAAGTPHDPRNPAGNAPHLDSAGTQAGERAVGPSASGHISSDPVVRLQSAPVSGEPSAPSSQPVGQMETHGRPDSSLRARSPRPALVVGRRPVQNAPLEAVVHCDKPLSRPAPASKRAMVERGRQPMPRPSCRPPLASGSASCSVP